MWQVCPKSTFNSNSKNSQDFILMQLNKFHKEVNCWTKYGILRSTISCWETLTFTENWFYKSPNQLVQTKAGHECFKETPFANKILQRVLGGYGSNRKCDGGKVWPEAYHQTLLKHRVGKGKTIFHWLVNCHLGLCA